MKLLDFWGEIVQRLHHALTNRDLPSQSVEVRASPLLFLIAFAGFCFEISNPSMGVDDYIHFVTGFSRNDFYISRGMWGALLVHQITPGPWITPTITLLIGLALNCLVAIVVGWILQLRTASPVALALVYGLIVVHPYFATQMAFSYLQIAYPLATLLAASGILISLSTRRALLKFSCASLAICGGLSIYLGSISMLGPLALLAPIFRNLVNREALPKPAWYLDYVPILISVVMGCASFLLLHELIFSLSGVEQHTHYAVRFELDFWNRLPAIWREIQFLFLGAGGIIPPLAILLLCSSTLIAILVGLPSKRIGEKCILLALLLMAAVSPYAILIAYSGNLAPRSTVGIAVLWVAVFAIPTLSKRRLLSKIGGLMLFSTVTIFCFQLNSMFFSQHLVSEADRTMINRVAERIDQLPGTPKENGRPIVHIVGSYSHPSLRSFYNSVLGFSNFEWDQGNAYRIAALAKLAGVDRYAWRNTKGQQHNAIHDQVVGRHAWPHVDSVFETPFGIVVWLGERREYQRLPTLLMTTAER